MNRRNCLMGLTLIPLFIRNNFQNNEYHEKVVIDVYSNKLCEIDQHPLKYRGLFDFPLKLKEKNIKFDVIKSLFAKTLKNGSLLVSFEVHLNSKITIKEIILDEWKVNNYYLIGDNFIKINEIPLTKENYKI